MNTHRNASLLAAALAAFALTATGCAAPLHLYATGPDLLDGPRGAMDVREDGVRLVALDSSAVPVDRSVRRQFTVVEIALVNDGREPLDVRLSDFALVDDQGRSFRPVRPYHVAGAVATAAPQRSSVFIDSPVFLPSAFETGAAQHRPRPPGATYHGTSVRHYTTTRPASGYRVYYRSGYPSPYHRHIYTYRYPYPVYGYGYGWGPTVRVPVYVQSERASRPAAGPARPAATRPPAVDHLSVAGGAQIYDVALEESVLPVGRDRAGVLFFEPLPDDAHHVRLVWTPRNAYAADAPDSLEVTFERR